MTAQVEPPNEPHASGSWQPVELTPIVAGVQAGEIVGPVPELMARTDGVRLLYPGKVHELHGEPETGKGWIALAAAAETAVTANVLYLDFEDSAESIVERLLALGTPPDAIIERFTYLNPCEAFDPKALTALLDARPYALALIDGVTEAYDLLGLDPYSNIDAAKFLATLPRPIAKRGTAVIEIDHVVKSKEARGRYGLGAGHKLAGIAATYSTDVIRQPSRTDTGTIKLKVEKDRHGHVRSHADGNTIALVHITPTDGGKHVSVTLEPPDTRSTDTGEFRPTALMAKVARYLEDTPGASKNAIREDIPGKREYLDIALQTLIREGYAECRKEGQTHRHYSLRPFDENTNRGPEAQPRPNRGPERSATTEAPRPSPTRGASTGLGAASHTNNPTEAHNNGHTDLHDGWTDAELEALIASPPNEPHEAIT